MTDLLDLVFVLEQQLSYFLNGIPFLIPLLAVLLVTHRMVGKEFGAERLFWNERWDVQFAAFFSAGMLVGVTLYVWYLIDRPHAIAEFVRDRAWIPSLFFLAETSPGNTRGAELYIAGKCMLIWLTLIAITLFVPKYLVGRQFSTKPRNDGLPTDREAFFLSRCRLWPGIVGYFASYAFAIGLHYLRHFSQPEAWREWVDRNIAHSFGDNLYPFGGAMGVISNPFIVQLKDAEPGIQGHSTATSNQVQITIEQLCELHTVALYLGLISLVFVLLTFPLAIVVRKRTRARASVLFGPMVYFCLVSILFVTFYGWFVFTIRLPWLVIAIALLLLMLLNAYQFFERWNPKYHKSQFINLEPEYMNPVVLSATVPQPSSFTPLDNTAILKAMCDRWQAKHGPATKPKIVLIATSGGGIRAATWTGVVLEGLDQCVPGLVDQIRIIAGASGGLVGGAMHCAAKGLVPQTPPDAKCLGMVRRDEGIGLRTHSGILARQSLLPLVQTMLLVDFLLKPIMPHAMIRWLRKRGWEDFHTFDRGWRTEWKWAKNAEVWGYAQGQTPFEQTFANLYPLEKSGDRPSLIASPMLLEDARRLLISNLDLSAVAELTPSPFAEPFGVQSRSALEFFKLFPQAHERFQVGTAARMAASFPVFASAVSLPTLPARRPVDGGYFDNYGVELLAQWLMTYRQAIREYTAGVLLIEIRAFPLKEQGLGFEAPAEWEPSAVQVGPMVRGLVDPIGSPIMGFLGTRVQSQYQRSRVAWSLVQQSYNDITPGFLQNVVFELHEDAALNWHISSQEKERIVRAFFTRNDRTVTTQGLTDLSGLHDLGGLVSTASGLQPHIAQRVDAIRSWFGNGGG